MKKMVLLAIVLILLSFAVLSFAAERRLASWYLLEGMKNYEQGLHIGAIVDFRAALHLNSNLVLAYKYLGQSYSKMYLWEQAAREYNKILFFSPASPERDDILKSIYEWEDKKVFLTAKARYTYYILKYRDLVWQEPYNFLNYMALAEIYESEGDYEKSVGFYRFLVSENPDKVIFNLYLAEALSLDGRIDEAESIYKKILNEEPLNVEATIGLNLIYKKRYEDNIKNDPSDISSHIGLARSLRDLKRFEKAADMYNRTIEKDYLNTDARMELAAVYESLGRQEDAIREYGMLNKIAPQAVQHLFKVAELYEKVGKIKDARETYNKVLAIDPYNQEAREGLERLKISYGLITTYDSEKEQGRGGLKDSSGYGPGMRFYVPFDQATNMVFGYSNHRLNTGVLTGIEVLSYLVGIERDLPLNYWVYARYLPAHYVGSLESTGNFIIGAARNFPDGGKIEASVTRQDMLDNQNTFNNGLTAVYLTVGTYNPMFEGKFAWGIDGHLASYSDDNSGIESKLFCKYELMPYPRGLSFIADISYANTAVTTGKVYWTPRDYYETRMGLSWKYSFDKKNHYTVDCRVGRDSDFVDSTGLSLEIAHELEAWLKASLKGDLYHSSADHSETLSFVLSMTI